MTVRDKLNRIRSAERRVEIAQDKLDELNREFVTNYIDPMLKIMGKDQRIGYVERFEEWRDFLRVHTTWESRGNAYHHDIDIPNDIIFAERPTEAAVQYRLKKQAADEAARREATLAQIARLQQSLE